VPLLTILALTILGAQSRPDYNGTWVLSSAKSAKAIQEGLSPVNGRMTLTITEKEVTIVNRVGKPGEANADGGTESRIVCGFGALPTENNQAMRAVLCSAKWDGDQLVTTRAPKSYPAMKPDNSMTVTRLSLAGTELKTTTTSRLASGKELTGTLVYDRAR